MVASKETIQLSIPQQDLRRLSFTGHQPRKFEAWVESLPMVNLGETARQLYAAIQELNRLELDPKHRFQLLEQIRPAINYVCTALGKHYLHQPILLPDKPRKVANLAQAMQNHLATGYKICVVHALPKARQSELQKIVAASIHRAITDTSRTLLRCYQLYYPTPPRLWYELHQLYYLADSHKLAERSVRDSENRYVTETRVQDAYLRTLLVATAKPNQLRQNEVMQLHQASEYWVGYAELSQSDQGNKLFLINLSEDTPPIYRNLVTPAEGSHLRYFDAAKLALKLQESAEGARAQPTQQKASDAGKVTIPREIASELLQHLIKSWGMLTERSFERTQQQGQIEVCLGLNALHYHISGGMAFKAQLKGGEGSLGGYAPGGNPFLNQASAAGGKDPWAMAHDSERGHLTGDMAPIEFTGKSDDAGSQNTGKPSKHDSHVCHMVDASPGGYCVKWINYVPTAVKTGEVIGVRENAQGNWNIGVIRWVTQLKKQGARMGIELLAPTAKPCGARAIHKSGEVTEYMRALLLPEIKAIGQPATLITPNIAFHVGYKVHINQGGDEIKAQLIKQVTATASFRQFQFKLLQQRTEKPPNAQEESQQAGEDNFDSLWNIL